MAKDTKQIIIQTLLKIAAENGTQNITVEEISRRSGITRNTIQSNFNNQGVAGIIDYINITIIQEINEQIFRFNPNELPIEIFIDIVITVLWRHRDEAHLIYTTPLPFLPADHTVELSIDWLHERYERLVKEHHLAPYFSAEELLRFYNIFLYACFSLWLSAKTPVPPEVFKEKFLYLMKTSMKDLIYGDIGLN
ncbi:MAG: TetR/AcrR family transcriptional regulator [Streptococcaceae bacterium]|nr:TetR/AcrR family transcriptional regulator [Streptococcaceae bacterium]